LELLVEADSQFHRLLAVMTRNHKLVNVMEQLNSGNETFWEYFIKNDEFFNNVIFAGYVEIVNAIKRGAPIDASEVAKRNIINACEWLSKIEKAPYWDMLESMKEQAENEQEQTKLFQYRR
jgi:DNA-binding FadR family transcriptional regulator